MSYKCVVCGAENLTKGYFLLPTNFEIFSLLWIRFIQEKQKEKDLVWCIPCRNRRVRCQNLMNGFVRAGVLRG